MIHRAGLAALIAMLCVVIPVAAAPGPAGKKQEVGHQRVELHAAVATRVAAQIRPAQPTRVATPTRTAGPTRGPTAAPARTPAARARTTPTPRAVLPTAVRVQATATPLVDEAAPEDVIAATPPESEPEPKPTMPPTVVRLPTARRVVEPAPTVEPTYETTVVDVAEDPNARSVRTPQATSTPRATLEPTVAPTPEVAGVQSSSLVDTVLMQTFEPMADGGRIGLLGGGVSLLVAFGMKLLRRRK